MTERHDKFHEIKAAVNQTYRLLCTLIPDLSIKAFRRFFLYHFRKTLLGQPIPYYMDIAVTNRCQCQCIHCYSYNQREDKRRELTISEIKAFLDQARRLGAFIASFTGGEPLLREDITEIIRYAHDLGFMTRLNTNALLLDRKMASQLKNAGLHQCAVSLDDADPKIHDRLRNVPGSHQKAIQGLKILGEFQIYAMVLAYVSKRTLASGLEKTIDLAKESGARSILLFPAIASGRWAETFEHVLAREEMARVRNLQDFQVVHLEMPSIHSICDAQKKFVLYLTPHGDLTPCPFVPYVIGNIKDFSLSAMWHHYVLRLNLAQRGFCPLNNEESREKFKRYIQSVSEGLRKSFPSST
jgi:MoaA/NifB/PqqE/SkfB family radical SAM enzyme